MYFGCAAICANGRPFAACSLALGVGMRMKRSSASVTTMNTISAR